MRIAVDRWTSIVLFFASSFCTISFGEETDVKCLERCERLFIRSMRRIGREVDTLKEEIIHTMVKSEETKSVCWKFSDYDDCTRKCSSDDKTASKLFGERDLLRRRCQRITAGSQYSKHFRCVHRFHTFLEVQCSSFAQEATKFRVLSKHAKAKTSAMGKDGEKTVGRDVYIQETCRYLHYHSMCLANAVFNYCPEADELFNRFTMRDYFLSFIIPADDRLFTDRLLDYCQLYDFQKMAKDLFDSTKSTTKRHLDNVHVTYPMELLTTTTLSRDPSKKPKKLFSSDEDLIETPPNFHFSSAKYSKHYTKAFQRENFYRTTAKNPSNSVEEFDLITRPVKVDFSFEANGADGYKKARRPTVEFEENNEDELNTQVTWPDVHPTMISIEDAINDEENRQRINDDEGDKNTDDSFNAEENGGNSRRRGKGRNRGNEPENYSKEGRGGYSAETEENYGKHHKQNGRYNGDRSHQQHRNKGKKFRPKGRHGRPDEDEINESNDNFMQDDPDSTHSPHHRPAGPRDRRPGQRPHHKTSQSDDNHDYNQQNDDEDTNALLTEHESSIYSPTSRRKHGENQLQKPFFGQIPFDEENNGEYVDEPDENGESEVTDPNRPILPFSKVHIAKIREFGEESPTENPDEFEVRTIDGQLDPRYSDIEDYEDWAKNQERIPSLTDAFHTIITSAFRPTTHHPAVTTTRRNNANTVLTLMVAYTTFFVAALIILISLIVAAVVRRKRQSYQTYIIKKGPPMRF